MLIEENKQHLEPSATITSTNNNIDLSHKDSPASRIFQHGLARYVPSRDAPPPRNPLLRSVSMLAKTEPSGVQTDEPSQHGPDSGLYGSSGQTMVTPTSHRDTSADSSTNRTHSRSNRRDPSPVSTAISNAIKAKSTSIGRSLAAFASPGPATESINTAPPSTGSTTTFQLASTLQPPVPSSSESSLLATPSRATSTVMSSQVATCRAAVHSRRDSDAGKQAGTASAAGVTSWSSSQHGGDRFSTSSSKGVAADSTNIPSYPSTSSTSTMRRDSFEQLSSPTLLVPDELDGRPSFSAQSSRRPSHSSITSRKGRRSMVAARLGFGSSSSQEDQLPGSESSEMDGRTLEKRRPSAGSAAMGLFKAVTGRKGKGSSGSSSGGSVMSVSTGGNDRVRGSMDPIASSKSLRLDQSVPLPPVPRTSSKAPSAPTYNASVPPAIDTPPTRPGTASSIDTFHTTLNDTPESSPELSHHDASPELPPFPDLAGSDLVSQPVASYRHRIDWIDSFGTARASPSGSTSAGSATEYTFASHGTSVHATSPSQSTHIQTPADMRVSQGGIDLASAVSKGKERAEESSPEPLEDHRDRSTTMVLRGTSVGLNEEQASSIADGSEAPPSPPSPTAYEGSGIVDDASRDSARGRQRNGARDRNSLLHLPHLSSFEGTHMGDASNSRPGAVSIEHEEEAQEVDESDTDSSQGDETAERSRRTDVETSSETELDETDDETERDASPPPPLMSTLAAPSPGFEVNGRIRPSGIVIPPPPVFRPLGMPTPRTSEQATVRAARPPARRIPTYDELHPASVVPPPTPNSTIGRQGWTQFAATTPAETPRSGLPAHETNAGLTSRTPRHAIGASETSYFTHQPALAQPADTLMEGAPPPSPSVITRSRAPSSASSRRSMLLNLPTPAPSREMPPLPPINTLSPLKFDSIAKRAASRESSMERGSMVRRDGSLRQVRPRPVTASSSSSSSVPRSVVAQKQSQPPLAPSPKPQEGLLAGTSHQPRTPYSVHQQTVTPHDSPRLGLYRLKSQSLVELSSPIRREAGEFPLVDSRWNATTPAGSPSQGLQALTPGSTITSRMAADMYEPPPTPMSPCAPSLRRRSMIQLGVEPPAYSLTHMRPDGLQTILPREEEGREKLPPYSCSVHIEGFLPRKMEFSAPGIQAKDRGWKRQYIVLHGTALYVYKNDAVASLASTGAWGHMEGVHVYGERMDEEASPLDGVVVAKGVDGSAHNDNKNSTVVAPHQEGRRHSEGSGLRSHMPSRRIGNHNHAPNSAGSGMSSVAQAVGATTRSSLSHIGGLGIANMPSSPSLPWTNPRLAEFEARTRTGIVRAYTLQSAESGLAADYLKRRHVVRVRAEGEQFLLQTNSDRAVVALIEALQAGTNISMDLERRTMPKFITLPRRNRRRRRRNPDGSLVTPSSRAGRPQGPSGGGGGGAGDAARANGDGAAGTDAAVSGGIGASGGQQPSDAFEEMLREEHADMARQPAALG